MLKRRLTMPSALAIFAGAAAIVALFLLAQPAAATSSGTVRVNPTTQLLSAPSPATITVTLIQNSGVSTTGAESDVTFNQTLLQVQSVALGSGYSGGGLIMGVSGQTQADVIAEANSTGTLNNVTAYTVPPNTVAPGDANVAVITFKSVCAGLAACASCGVSNVALSGEEMLDDASADMTVTGTDGTLSSAVIDLNTPFGTQDWPIPALPTVDADCDGFPDSVNGGGKARETLIGTDPAVRCAATGTANDEGGLDAMPPDFNDNQLINGQDTGKFGGPFGAGNHTVAQGPFGPPGQELPGVRFDWNGDGVINGQDIGKFAPYNNKKCA